MNPQERLFAAIGGVDEGLLERSERAGRRTRARYWMACTAATAACAAVVAAAWMWTWSPPAAAPVDPPPVPPVGSLEEPPPRLEGQGEYHLLDFSMGQDEDPGTWPSFSIYYNDADYKVYQPQGSYFIRPRSRVEGMPLCQLEISYYGECTLEEAVELRRRHDEMFYDTVTLVDADSPDRGVGLPENAAPVCLLASDGTDWDDRQSDSWFVEDGQGGVFVLSSAYFLEAAEGFGARFFDMVCTFRVETGQDAPPWRRALENGTWNIMEAVFAGDLTGAEHLLALEEPAEGVLDHMKGGGASVAQIDYSVSQTEEGLAAAVEVKYRFGVEQPYEYLDMRLIWKEGSWLATRLAVRDPAVLPPAE